MHPMPTPSFRAAFDLHAPRLMAEAAPDWRASLLGPEPADAVARQEAEAFVAAVYRERYGATLHAFLPWLLAFRDREGTLLAVVGLRPAGLGDLFVEQYLDVPAERAASAALAQACDRDAMVEVGGLAARRPGDARRLILCLTRGLRAAGLRWVLFSATRQLRNAFDRLGLRTVALAPADPARLRPSATDWGRYYETQPMLLCGDLAAGAAFLDAAVAANAANAAHPRAALAGAGA